MGRRSRFECEFKRQAVELVRLSMRTRNEIAASLGIADATLGRWMTAFSGNDDGAFVREHSPRRNHEAIVEAEPQTNGRMGCTNHLLHRWPEPTQLLDDHGPMGWASPCSPTSDGKP
ncbi:MAG: transposase [Acidimicrobiales bacterium]